MARRTPSDDEFAEARKRSAERDRSLDKVRRNVMKKLHAVLRLPLHDFFVLSQGDAGFRAYVFLNSDEDVMACKRSGDLADIEDCVYEQLEMAGRGTRNEIVVAFEYDSDENVQRSFKGNYYLRLL